MFLENEARVRVPKSGAADSRGPQRLRSRAPDRGPSKHRSPVATQREAIGEVGTGPRCGRCRQPAHRFDDLPGGAYAYLLGQYLGDGTIHASGRGGQGLTLRISTDALYPRIIHECCVVIGQIRGRRPATRRHPDERMVYVTSSWPGWACLLPQHGPGRKHSREIQLVPWQDTIVKAYPAPFIRGLIHSDGWRGLNRVQVKGRKYGYPRYQFSNRSDDIRRLFTYACELVGVEWRRWGKWHVSVAKRGSVALLDELVGPKA